MRKVLLLTVLAFFAATTGILAQLTAGASLVFVKPLGGFAQNVNNTAGIGLNLGYRINNLPIEAGLSFSFVSYANVTERVPYSEPNYQHTEADRERCSGVICTIYLPGLMPLKTRQYNPMLMCVLALAALLHLKNILILSGRITARATAHRY